jgi:diaminohydroxyphosphoribosylaminopyrimidine deaminase/5-amino-6-(5-phosphoribosylamino)uracil reductase
VTQDADIRWMRQAIALAGTRLGETWPNPAVGCLLVKDGQLIAQAATARGGRPHAEEQALAAGSAAGADAYVTLEPCAHRSNHAPSCSERLIAAGVRRVIIACENPDARSAGAGLERLSAAGIEVLSGVLGGEAQRLYRGFLHRLQTGRPLLEAAADGVGFDALFEPRPEEALAEALTRYGKAGYTRIWTPRQGALAEAAAAQGLLDGSGAH